MDIALMNLSQIWNANRKLALTIFIGVGIIWEVVVIITAFSLPKIYRATAVVEVQVSGANREWNLIQNDAQAILSTKSTMGVIDKLHLNEEWGRRYFNGDKLTSVESLRILLKRLSVEPATNSPVISILSFNDNSEEAADIANALAEAYQRHHLENTVTSQTNLSGKMISPTVSVQIINKAQPDHRAYKPNIPFEIGKGIPIAAIYGAIAAALAVGLRLLLKKLPVPKALDSNSNKPPMPPIAPKY